MKGKSEKELLELRIQQLDKLCPVFKENCKGDNCMSYNPGFIWEQLRRPGIPIIASPGCNNAIVTGTIESA